MWNLPQGMTHSEPGYAVRSGGAFRTLYASSSFPVPTSTSALSLWPSSQHCAAPSEEIADTKRLMAALTNQSDTSSQANLQLQVLGPGNLWRVEPLSMGHFPVLLPIQDLTVIPIPPDTSQLYMTSFILSSQAFSKSHFLTVLSGRPSLEEGF